MFTNLLRTSNRMTGQFSIFALKPNPKVKKSSLYMKILGVSVMNYKCLKIEKIMGIQILDSNFLMRYEFH